MLILYAKCWEFVKIHVGIFIHFPICCKKGSLCLFEVSPLILREELWPIVLFLLQLMWVEFSPKVILGVLNLIYSFLRHPNLMILFDLALLHMITKSCANWCKVYLTSKAAQAEVVTQNVKTDAYHLFSDFMIVT